MPVFTQQKKSVKTSIGGAKGISQEVVDQYKKYIQELGKGHLGTLEFKKDENINLARKALQQAGEELKQYIRVRKLRGQANKLTFERIKRKEWVEAQKAAKARGEKLKGKPKPRRRKRG